MHKLSLNYDLLSWLRPQRQVDIFPVIETYVINESQTPLK